MLSSWIPDTPEARPLYCDVALSVVSSDLQPAAPKPRVAAKAGAWVR
jgi:hypothetical protein